MTTPTIEAVYGQFWNTRTKGWTAWIDGKCLSQRHGMNHQIKVARRFNTREAAEAAARAHCE